jgi:cytochrome P450
LTDQAVAAAAKPRRLGRLSGVVGTAAMITNPARHLTELTMVHGDCFIYPFGGVVETLVVSRPSLIQHVLKNGEETFGKSDIQTRHMHAYLGKGLLTLVGEPWRRQRKVIASGFRSEALQALSTSTACLVEARLIRLAVEADEGEPIAIDRVMNELTFRATTRALLGADIAEDGIGLISEAIGRIQSHLVRRIVLPWAAPWFYLSGAESRHQALRRAGDSVLAAAIDRRLKVASISGAYDILDALLAVRDSTTGSSMAQTDLVAELMQLLVAGHETSSTVLTWTLWLLAGHPESLTALRHECSEQLAGSLPKSTDFSRLPLAVATLKEAMRLYPPFWMIDRVALTDSECDGVAIGKGTRVALLVSAVHRRPDFWAKPGDFCPARFLGNERANERNGAFVPFGTGPRTCVGNGYAWMQMLTILTGLIQRFDITATEDEVKPSAKLILRPAGGIRLELRRRIGT